MFMGDVSRQKIYGVLFLVVIPALLMLTASLVESIPWLLDHVVGLPDVPLLQIAAVAPTPKATEEGVATPTPALRQAITLGPVPEADDDGAFHARVIFNTGVPEAWRAPAADSARYRLQITAYTTAIERCEYTTGIRERWRVDANITLMDLDTGELVASRPFTGMPPDSCPFMTETLLPIVGYPPETDLTIWLVGLDLPALPEANIAADIHTAASHWLAAGKMSSGGTRVVDFSAFRTGTQVVVSAEAAAMGLVLRDKAALDAPRVAMASAGSRWQIVNGPQIADGWFWWLLASLDDPALRGWGVQDFLEVAPEP